eukprot:scaffold298_cov247-Pinguiococcus_pyrenoidosus.AAC.5
MVRSFHLRPDVAIHQRKGRIGTRRLGRRGILLLVVRPAAIVSLAEEPGGQEEEVQPGAAIRFPVALDRGPARVGAVSVWVLHPEGIGEQIAVSTVLRIRDAVAGSGDRGPLGRRE